MNSLETGVWKPIDNNAKRLKDVLVRKGSSYARARWHNGRWVYFVQSVEDPIDFEPTEYRVSL